MIVANEYEIRAVVRKLSRKTRCFQVCEACDEEENSWIFMLGLDSLRHDGNEEGSGLLIDSGAALSACPPQFCAGTTRLALNFQVADVHRPMIAVRDLTTMGCEAECSKHGACSQTGGRRWLLEHGRRLFFLSVDSLRGVSKTWLHDEIAPLEVSLIPEAGSEALLPSDHDREKHEPDLPIELRAPRVKRGPRDPTDDEVTQHEPVAPAISKLVSHLHRRAWCGRSTRRRDTAKCAAGLSVSHWE